MSGISRHRFALGVSQTGATLVIAASNSSAEGISKADKKCSGADDQTEINEALAELTNGGRVLLLEGTYSISGDIQILSNSTLMGCGDGTIIQMESGHDSDILMIRNDDQTSGNTNICIRDLKVDGNRANIGPSLPAVTGIDLVKVTKAVIDNVHIANVYNEGMTLDTGCSNILVSNCYFYNNDSGIRLAPNGSSIVDSIIDTCIFEDNVRYGIEFNNSLRCTLTNSIITGTTTFAGVIVDLTNDYSVITNNSIISNNTDGIRHSGDYAIISNNTVRSNGDVGIYTVGSYNTITNNLVMSNTTTGMTLGCSYSVISNNVARLNGTYGLLVVGHHNTIQGNSCDSNSQTTDNTYDNIRVSSADYNNIQGNTCRQGSEANKPKYGLNVSNATSDANVVTNNDLYDGGKTSELNDSGAATVTAAGNRP